MLLCVRRGIPVAVAVSGGVDSMALCLLAHQWALENDSRIVALTVDHALRPESLAEAAQVKTWLTVRGIEHHTLVWEREAIAGNLQAKAREARYRLLTGWCRANNIETLLVAHTQEDQAETFLLRLARGSGVDGLSAMPAVTGHDGVRIVRPLLGIPKTRLIATLDNAKQEWLEDPSNRDASFDRVKFRQAQKVLSELGLTPQRLAQTARTLSRARQALEAMTDRLLAEVTRPTPQGTLLEVARLLAAQEEIGLRTLSRIVREIGKNSYPARLEDIERLYLRLKENGQGCTLGGCRFRPLRKKAEPGLWIVTPEDPR